MGHVSPGGRPHGHHSGPRCTALLSLCIYNAQTKGGRMYCIHNSLMITNYFPSIQRAFLVHLHQTWKIESTEARRFSLASCHLSFFSFFCFSFFFFCNHICTVSWHFLQIEDTATHSWSLDLLSCVQLADTFSALQLTSFAFFRQKPEFQGV
jgi:hypothetical protein